MASFVVMEPPGAASDGMVERAALVRDGFSLPAFLVPPLWLAWHRLWIEALLALAAALGLTALGEVAGHGLAGSALSLLLSIYIGLEGTALRVAALRRRGWTEWGVVDAETAAEAEIRYASAAAEAGAAVQPLPPHPPARLSPPGPSFGLFAYPAGRTR